jgi:hypothetical protein
MNIDDSKKSRAVLKSYFVKNAIPTEQQFAQVMDSMLNQRDDGLVKVAGDPLSIEATGDDTGFKKALNFYNRLSDNAPAWTVSLRPRSNLADPQTGHAGLSINDAAGNSRLAVDAATGRVGIGTVTPGEQLEVSGRIKAGPLAIGPWPANPAQYVFFGAGTLDQAQQGNYALLQSFGGGDAGTTFVNSPATVRFRIGNADRMVLAQNGSLGIGTPTPSEPLEVNGRIRAGALAIGPWPASAGYVFFGSTNLDQTQGGNYALLQGTGSDGTTFLNSPTSLRLRINNGDCAVIDGSGNFTVSKGSLTLGNSDMYFTKTDHNHTGIGNTQGYAAIENSANYGGLMILGRSTPGRRVVKLWDYLEVNGDLMVTGRIGSLNKSPDPLKAGWGGGLHTWDVEAEGTVWSRNGVQSGPRDLAEIYFSDISLVPGEVVSLDPESDRIVPASEANCSRVIGVVSTEPGVLLNSQLNRTDQPSDGRSGFPIALSGCVPCKVTDEGGPIRRGDLLTAASRSGYAMRATPIGAEGVYRAGTVIGKALSAHGAGEGVIEIFVMLH